MELETVAAGGFEVCAAPVMAPDGTAWFCDTAGGVFRIAPGADAIDEVHDRAGVGGLAVHERGGVVASGATVVRVDDDGSVEDLFVLEDQTTGITGFTGVAVDGQGWVVVGALRFDPGRGEAPIPGRIVVVAHTFVAVAVDEGVLQPGGIGFSGDRRTGYVADVATRAILAVDVDRQGALAETARSFAAGLPGVGGLAVDVDGGVWVATGAGGGLVRLDADGAVTARVDGIAPFVSSIALGGPDGRDVLVSTGGGEGGGRLLRGRSPVAGVPLAPATI